MTTNLVDYRIFPKETQIVKGFAICAMLVHHLFLEHLEYGFASYQLALIGKICVALFVFLSGYGMTIQFVQIRGKNSFQNIQYTIHFICKRLLRFYANYWIIFLIFIPLGIFVFGRSLETAYGKHSDVFRSLLIDFLGFQGFSSYNITWWFNAVILSLWILYPLLYWLMHSWLTAIPTLLILLFNPGDILYPLHHIAIGLPFHLVFFVEGILWANHIDLINTILNKAKKKFVLYGSIVLSIFLLLVRNPPNASLFYNHMVDFFAVLSIPLATVSLCRSTSLAFSFGVFLGKHSMNVYLTHTFIVAYFFSDFIYEFKNPMAIFAVLLTQSFALSMIIEFFKKKFHFYTLLKNVTKIIALPMQNIH